MTEEVKVEAKVTPEVKPVVKPKPKFVPKARMVVGDRSTVEKFVDVSKTVATAVAKEVKAEPKLPANVLAEQAAGRRALEKNVKK